MAEAANQGITARPSLVDAAAVSEIFSGARPVEIEIGCGKGKFLIGRSQAHPEIQFLGIDRVGKWMKIGAKRSEKRNLPNLRFLKSDIRLILEKVPPEGVSVFHIYFPDPWPKRRHRKRRLVNAGFLLLLWEKLRPGGLIEMATDDLDYFTAMKKAAALPEALAGRCGKASTGAFWIKMRKRITN